MLLDTWTFRGSHAFYDKKLQTLAAELPPERWSASGKSDFGILRSYIAYTFDKLWSEREAAQEESKSQLIYEDDIQACFNTGLYDKHWQPIFFYCERNPRQGYQKWEFKDFFNSYTMKYTSLPSTAVAKLRRPNFFTDPSALIFDINRIIVPQWNHILDEEENYMRIPEQIRNGGKDFCRNVIKSQIDAVSKRIEANYKTVVPQWYRGKIQLLVPLYLTNQNTPDLALVLSVSDDGSQYFGHTCLTTEMAYNNARVIARPDSYWLQP